MKKNAHVLLAHKDYNLWHDRLGHLSAEKFTTLKTKEMVGDPQRLKGRVNKEFVCESCIYGKLSRTPLN